MAVDKSDPGLSYEETRKQRVEENKRRMEELGLMDLSKDLKNLKQKNPAKKPVKRKMHSQDDAGLESRRSSRVAAKPAVSYRDQLDLLPGMRARIGNRERQGLPRRYLSDHARLAAVEAAEEVFKDIKNPAFIKPMLHSHVSSCFWLGLPHQFCKKHMPPEDERFILEDDKEKEWECLFLAHKTGMSGGWRGFSLDHELVDGDCCIFELVSPLRFKVLFFRCEEEEGGLEEVDGKEAPAKVAGAETTTEKKVSKSVTKKKAGLPKARKSSKSSSKKVKLEDGESAEDNEEDEDDDRDDYSTKKDVAGSSRASRAARRNKLVEEEDNGGGGHAAGGQNGNEIERNKQGGKKPVDLIELEDGEDEEARNSAAVTKTSQAGSGSLPSGRATRNSLRRSFPP